MEHADSDALIDKAVLSMRHPLVMLTPHMNPSESIPRDAGTE